MTQKMLIELRYEGGGGIIENEVEYEGTPEEVARDIGRDNNALLEFMMDPEEAPDQKSFCFQGFMFRKKGLVTARMREPEW